MHLKGIVDESFAEYKEASMLLITPSCDWKCRGCNSRHLSQLETKNFPDEEILKRFVENSNTTAIVIAGLEPMDNVSELWNFLFSARKFFDQGTRPLIIIYTGYDLEELKKHYWSWLEAGIKQYGNVILKCGRYKADRKPYFSTVLGITLPGRNQLVYDYYGHQYE